jgi:hypothetical protein
MEKSRKKLGIELLIDDATLRAIGHVSAQWAVLEIEFDTLLGQLLRHPDAKGIAPDQIPQSFDRRAGLLGQCAERPAGADRDYQRRPFSSGAQRQSDPRPMASRAQKGEARDSDNRHKASAKIRGPYSETCRINKLRMSPRPSLW